MPRTFLLREAVFSRGEAGGQAVAALVAELERAAAGAERLDRDGLAERFQRF
jgi:hypothetical protein